VLASPEAAFFLLVQGFGFWFEVRALEIREEDSRSGAERKRSGSRASPSAAGVFSLRGFPRCGGGFLVAGRSHCEATISGGPQGFARGETAAGGPTSGHGGAPASLGLQGEERLLRGFPRCGDGGLTLGAPETER
jgi:hypothetical protein